MIKYSVLFFVLILIDYGTALSCYTHGVVYASDSNTDVENILKVTKNRKITKVECQGTENRCVNGVVTLSDGETTVPVGFCGKSTFDYTFARNIKDPDGMKNISPPRASDFSALCSYDLCNNVTKCSLYGVELDETTGNPTKFIQEESGEKYVVCPTNQCAQAYVSYKDGFELTNQWIGYCKEIDSKSEITEKKYCENLESLGNKAGQPVSSCITSYCEGDNCNVKNKTICANYGVNSKLDGSLGKITDDIRITYQSCSGDCISGTVVFEKSIQSNDEQKISAGFCAPKSFSMEDFMALATDVAKGRQYTIDKFDRCNTDFCNEKNLNKCLNYGVDVDNRGQPVTMRDSDKDIQVISCPTTACSSGYIEMRTGDFLFFGHCGSNFPCGNYKKYAQAAEDAICFESCFSNNCNIKLLEKPEELYCYIYGIGDEFDKDGFPLIVDANTKTRTTRTITQCPRNRQCASASVTQGTDTTSIGFCAPLGTDAELVEQLGIVLKTTTAPTVKPCKSNYCNRELLESCPQYGLVYNMDGSIKRLAFATSTPPSSVKSCDPDEDICVYGTNNVLFHFGFCAKSRTFNANLIINQLSPGTTLKICYTDNCQ